VLGVADDGIVGPVTLAAINGCPDQKALFDRLWERRKKHFEDIVRKDPAQSRFLRGWLNRLNDFKFVEE
jgi:lysozyme family protein